MKGEIFSKKLVRWYEDNRRDLPWRSTHDPYRIWLSEIILQQTRVKQGIPYYKEFIQSYGSVCHLARAKESQVLRLWQGLGYYIRARNLLKCAQIVCNEWGGNFPRTFESLRKLPGIGDYTAAAIASIAFGEHAAVVDGNVYRVLSRIFGIRDDISDLKGRKIFKQLANDLLPLADPGTHNQAVMEFGALQCLPVAPHCDDCIFRTSCFAYKHDLQDQLPVKTRKPKIRVRHITYFILRKGNKIFMHQRTGSDIWRGLYDFPSLETNRSIHPRQAIRKKTGLNVEGIRPRMYKHVLTHQHLRITVVELNWNTGLPALTEKEGRWYTPTEIRKLPKPVLLVKDLAHRGIL